MSRKTRLNTARSHGRRAINELRHAAADSALYWILSHKARVTQFRRAVKGTRAAKAVDSLLEAIREDATRTTRARAPKRRRVARRRRRAIPASRFVPPPFPIL